MRRKGLLVGVLILGIFCFASQSAMAQGTPHYLDGLWFKLKAVVKGYNVDRGTGDTVVHNFTVPLYMSFVWNSSISMYDVRLYTETEPGTWTNRYGRISATIPYNQNFFRDCYLKLYTSSTDWFGTYHTPYIKYVLDDTGAVKKATYSGVGEVIGGSFDADASECFGSVQISGTTVSVSNLPFTPTRLPSVPMPSYPQNKSVFNNYPRTTTFYWSGSIGEGPITYTLEVQYSWCAGSDEFGSWAEGCYAPLVFGGLTSTQYTFDFVGGQPGRWRVKASNSYGESDWSEWWYFRYTR